MGSPPDALRAEREFTRQIERDGWPDWGARCKHGVQGGLYCGFCESWVDQLPSDQKLSGVPRGLMGSPDHSRRVIVAKGNRKRELHLPFGVCGSREALEAMRDSLTRWLNDPGNGCGITYGWCRLDPPDNTEYVYGPPDTEPEKWDE